MKPSGRPDQGELASCLRFHQKNSVNAIPEPASAEEADMPVPESDVDLDLQISASWSLTRAAADYRCVSTVIASLDPPVLAHISNLATNQRRLAIAANHAGRRYLAGNCNLG
jgi:hypothetical protein